MGLSDSRAIPSGARKPPTAHACGHSHYPAVSADKTTHVIHVFQRYMLRTACPLAVASWTVNICHVFAVQRKFHCQPHVPSSKICFCVVEVNCTDEPRKSSRCNAITRGSATLNHFSLECQKTKWVLPIKPYIWKAERREGVLSMLETNSGKHELCGEHMPE